MGEITAISTFNKKSGGPQILSGSEEKYDRTPSERQILAVLLIC
jgi:hypothetical protein